MSDTTTAEVKAEETITELEKFEVERLDGVGNPANGVPVLMMKALPEKPAEQPAAAPPAPAPAPVIDYAALAKAVAAELKTDPTSEAVADGGKKMNTKKAGRDKTQVESLVSDAVAKATKASEERVQALEAQLAKVMAQPIPGGPVMSIATSPSGMQREQQDRAAKAAEYRAMAAQLSDPVLAESYRQLAAQQLEEKAATAS